MEGRDDGEGLVRMTGSPRTTIAWLIVLRSVLWLPV
jgi:hypothetical protein